MDDKFRKEVEEILKKQGVPLEISRDMDTFLAEVERVTQAIQIELRPHILVRAVEIVSQGERMADILVSYMLGGIGHNRRN